MTLSQSELYSVFQALAEVAMSSSQEGCSRVLLNVIRRSFLPQGQKKKWRDDEWDPTPKACLYPGCPDPAIRSHVLQKKRLKNLAGPTRNNPSVSSLAALSWDHNKGKIRINDDISIDKASIFPGYCACHDDKFFREIEGSTPADPIRELHLQSHRSYCRELRKVAGEVNFNTQALAAAQSGEAEHLKDLFKAALPKDLLGRHPYVLDFLSFKGDAWAEFKSSLDEKVKLQAALDAMRPEMDIFIRTGNVPCLDFVELENRQNIPLALSGVNPLIRHLDDKPNQYVPCFLVVMPPGPDPNRIFLFVPRGCEPILKQFLFKKGIINNGDPSRNRCRATLAFIEQFLVTASDHWFMTPSFWDGISSRGRQLVIDAPSIDLSHKWNPLVLKNLIYICS